MPPARRSPLRSLLWLPLAPLGASTSGSNGGERGRRSSCWRSHRNSWEVEMSTPHDQLIDRKPMRNWIERWAPIGGIVFVVFMVVGSRLVSDVPLPDAPEREIVNYLADGSAHIRNIIGAYLWVVGALVFLWFLTRLHSDLRRAERGTGTLSNLAFGAGVAFAAVWTVSGAAFAAVPSSIDVSQSTH